MSIYKVINKLNLIMGWAQEKNQEGADLERHLAKDREKIIELTLKNNELARENSLLQIANNKAKNMHSRYENAVM